MKLNRLTQKLKDSPLSILLGVIAGSLAFIVSFSTVVSLFTSNILNKLLEKKIITENVESLAPETNISYFKSKLGEPVFVNKLPKDEDEVVTERGAHNEQINEKGKIEYVFIHKYYYISAATDEEDKVLYYSVTTRDKSFNPEIELKNVGFKVILGKTMLSDVEIDPDVFSVYLGARRLSYFERYYFGNPGGYMWFGIGINDASDVITNHSNLADLVRIVENNPDMDSIFNNQDYYLMRKNVVINTYVEYSRFYNVTYTGADLDQVRLVE